MAILTITIKGDDQASDKVEKLAKAFTQLEQGAKRAGEGLDKAAAQTGKLSKAAQAVDGAGRQARIGLGAAAQAAEHLVVNIGGVVGPAAGAADAIGDMAGAGAALGPVDIAVGALVIGIGLAAAAIDKYNQSQAATVMQTDAVIQSMHGLITTNKAAAAAAQEYALAQAQAITFAQKGLSTNLGDYAQAAADAVLNLDKATNGVMRFIPQWNQQVAGAYALGEAVESSAEKADKLRAALVNLPFNEMRDALNQLTAQDPFERLAQSAGLSADKLKEMAAASGLVRDKLNELISVEQTLAILQAQRAEISRQLADAQAAGDTARVAELTAKLDENTAAMERVRQKANEVHDALQNMVGDKPIYDLQRLENAARAAANNGMTAVQDWNKKVEDAQDRVARAMGIIKDPIERWEKDQIDAYQNTQRAAERWAQAVSAAMQKVRALVEAAMTPTQVTLDDLNAAMTGKYIPKWDEFRRRVEAVATGTNIDQFGPKFKAQLEMVQSMFQNLNLDQIAAKFKDFSLFADMDFSQIKQLIDFGPIEQQVSQQVDAIIGKAKAMKVAFDEVWSSLSTQKKIDLAQALNIDANAVNVEGLKNQIAGAVTGATTGVADAATAGLTNGLNTAATKAGDLGKTLASSLTPGITALKGALDTLVPSLQTTGDTLTKVTNPAFGAFDGVTKNILTTLVGIKPALDADLQSFDAFVSALPAYQTTILDLITNALDPLRNSLSGIVDELQSIINKAQEAAAALAAMNGAGGTGTQSPTGTPPTNPSPTGQQHGGAGVLARDTLFYAHAGEGYWFSGVPWRIPPPSSGGGSLGPPAIQIGTVVVRDPEDAKKLAREIIAEWEENLMRSGRALERH